MAVKNFFSRQLIVMGFASMVLAIPPAVLADTSVHVGIHRHLHQPNYWGEPASNAGRPKQSQHAQDSQALKDANQAYYGDSIQHPENILVGGENSVFEKSDKQNAYQHWIKSSIGAMGSSDAGMTISYSGALQRNLWSFGRYNQAGYSPGWNNENTEAYNWKTSGNRSRAEVLGQTYHHAFSPLLPKSVLRKEIAMHRERTRKSWGLNPDMSDQSTGFWPIELAFSRHLIPILAEFGYQWVMIPNSHLARTCPNYMDALAQPNPGAELKADPPNRADQLGPTVPLNQWYGANRDTYGNVFPVPFAYQVHKAKYVNPDTGAETKMTVVPQCDYHGYQSGYAAVGWEHIDGKIAQFNDPNQPCLVMLTNDGENYWGGGNSFWNEFAPNFMNDAPNHGKKAITISEFLATHPAPDNDVVHVEDGSWLASDQGSPQFYRWLEPPRRLSGIDWSNPNTIFDLENGWHSDMRNWAVMMAGVNHCETAEQIFTAGGGQVYPWRIEEPYQDDGTDNNPNTVEQAWHFLLWGFDSGFLYFGDSLDDEVKHTFAANRAISTAASVIGNGSQDATPPTVFKPQRFPWNPGGKGKGQYLGGLTSGSGTVGFTTPPWPSDFYIWTLAYDLAGLNQVTLKIRVDADGVNSLGDNANEVYAGGAGVGSWISIPMNVRAMPKNDPTGNSNLRFFVLPDKIADYCWAKVTGYRNKLLDYYIEATDAKGNVAKSDIQHVYVEDDGTPGGDPPYATFSPSAPSNCTPITVTFNATTSVLAGAATVYGFYHFTTNTNDWATAPMTRASSNTFTLTFAPAQIPANATQLEICFNDGVNWESSNGANWKTAIRDCDVTPAAVVFDPAAPNGCNPVVVRYYPNEGPLQGAANVRIHVGRNGWQDVVDPDPAMTQNGSYWEYTYAVPTNTTLINACFNTVGAGSTNWDNNGGLNWSVAVANCGQVAPAVSIDPANPVGCDSITITYNPAGRVLASANPVYIHVGRNGWQNVINPDPAMTASGANWTYVYTPAPGTTNIDMVFNAVSGSTTNWDNNDNADWHFAVAGCGSLPPGLYITNPPANVAVGNAVATCDLAGTAEGLDGQLLWSNTLTGATGSIPVAASWTLPGLALGFGANEFTVRGSNVTAGGATTNAYDATASAAYAGNVWTNGSNGGSGFAPWVFTHAQGTGYAGGFIGNPTNAGIAGMGTNAFGFYANPTNSGANAEAARSLASPMAVGDVFQFVWGLNWDSNYEGSNRGFNLLAGETELVNLNMANSAAITINGAPMFTNYGAQAMTLNFQYVTAGSLRVWATGRNGVDTYDQTLAVSNGAPSGIKFYFNATDAGVDARQMYFNNLKITSGGMGADFYADSIVVTRAGGGPAIPPITFEAGAGFWFDLPGSYSLIRVEGATDLVGQNWNWATLAAGLDYSVTGNRITILTGGAEKRLIRIWLGSAPP